MGAARAARRAGSGRARRGVLGAAVARPGRVLAVALAAAAIGWGVDTQTEVRSDLPELVPQDLAAVRDLETLQAHDRRGRRGGRRGRGPATSPTPRC